MRKKKPIKKHQRPDDNPVKMLVTKIMWNGNKSKAWKIIYQTEESLKKELDFGIDKALEEAIANLRPQLETRKKRLGGISQLIPKKVEPERGLQLALRWLVEAARKNTKKKRRKGIGRPMFYCLAQEIIKARQKSGEAFKKKEAEQQKAADSVAFASFATYHS